MKKVLIYAIVLVLFICMISCKATGQTTLDKNEFGISENAFGLYHGFEKCLYTPFIFIGEFTG